MTRRWWCVPAILLLWMLASGVLVAGINRWTTNLTGIGDVSVAMDPYTPEIVYASTSGALFRSVDGGEHWSRATGSDFPGGTIGVPPGLPKTVYSSAAVNPDGSRSVRKSTDAGETFASTPALLGAMSRDSIHGPVMDPRAPDTLYLWAGAFAPTASTTLDGIYRTTDAGKSWAAVVGPGYGSWITSLIVSPRVPVVLATEDSLLSDQWLESGDDGTSWTAGPAFCGVPVCPNIGTAFEGIDSFGNVYVASACGRLFRGLCSPVEADDGLPVPVSLYSLAIDPVEPERLFAATQQGVYRSVDFGAHWTKFSDGLADGPATSLTIDATGRFLHVAAGGGVYDMTIAEPCTPAPTLTSLCFLGGRFLATVAAVDPRTGRLEHGTAVSRGDQFGYFSLPGFTGDAAFPEIVVKMADARAIPGQGFWVFHTGLTDLQYTLSVLDTQTGRQQTYRNDRSDPQELCGGADTATFGPDASVASSFASSTQGKTDSSPLTLFDRFQATLTATDPRTGRVADGLAVPQDAKWGYFSLPAFTGDPAFPEVLVKMVDATSLPGAFFWVFHTGLTDLEYELTVTDSKSGAVKVYRNDRSDPTRLCGGADTAAFTN